MSSFYLVLEMAYSGDEGEDFEELKIFTTPSPSPTFLPLLQKPPSPPPPCFSPPAIPHGVKSLLTKRENNIEDFIKTFVTDNQSDADELLDEADEQAFMSEAENKLAEASLLLSHKYGTVLKAHLARKQ